MQKFSGEVNNFLAAKSSKIDDIIDVYNQAINRGAGTIIGAGYRQVKAIAVASSVNPEIAFIISDWQVNAFKKVSDGSTVLVPQGDVASIIYRSEEAGFLAGLEAANYASNNSNAAGPTDDKAKVPTFGAMDLPPIRLYMEGFKKGVDWFNEQTTPDRHIELVTSKPGGVILSVI